MSRNTFIDVSKEEEGLLKTKNMGAQWRNGNAAASQQERSGFDSWKGHCGHCVMCPLLHVIGAHTLAGVGDRAFLCGVRMLSLCPQGVLMSPQLTKAMHITVHYTASSWPKGA